MGRFDRYLLSQLMVLFGFFSLVLILVYWINRAVVLFDQLISDGQTAGVFLEFTALSLPPLIRIVLPLAAFVAALYVTNRLTTDSELTVVQATGYSPFRLARPVLAFGLIAMLLTGAQTHLLVPASAAQLADRRAEIATNITARFLTEGQFLTPADGITVYVREVTPDGVLHDLFLSDTRDPQAQVIYTAGNAYLVRTDRGPQLVMVDGLAQTLRASDERLFTTRFEDFVYDIGGLIEAGERGRRSMREIPTPDLLFPDEEVLELTRRDAPRLRVEAHERTNQALMAVVAALLGFSTLLVGSFSRFGVWRQILGAILLVVIINGMETVGLNIAEDRPALWPAVYLPTVTGLVMVLTLLTLASRPTLLRRRRVPVDAAEVPA